jgi:topoisomerase IA-like protein
MNATVPKESDHWSIALEQALQMLAERESRKKERGRSGRRRR